MYKRSKRSFLSGLLDLVHVQDLDHVQGGVAVPGPGSVRTVAAVHDLTARVREEGPDPIADRQGAGGPIAGLDPGPDPSKGKNTSKFFIFRFFLILCVFFLFYRWCAA